MRYREATPADWPAVAALHAESWQTAYRGALTDAFLDGPVLEDRRAVWAQRLLEPRANQFVVLAEEDAGSIVGFACAYGDEDLTWGTLLDNLHVRPDRHGGGIGKWLVARIAAWCREKYPASGLYLGVLEQNSRARRFYERLGAADRGGDTWNPPGGGSTTVRRYVWSIEQVKALSEGTGE